MRPGESTEIGNVHARIRTTESKSSSRGVHTEGKECRTPYVLARVPPFALLRSPVREYSNMAASKHKLVGMALLIDQTLDYDNAKGKGH